MKEGNNDNYTLKVYQEAGHGLAVGGHHNSGFPKYTEGHIQDIKTFIQQKINLKE